MITNCNESDDCSRNGTRSDRRDLLLCAALLIIGIIVFGRGITVGGLRWGDAGVHAMDGVLIYDWITAGPSAWIDPVGFAARQYGCYPSLGIGGYYPPGFAIIEAAFFAVFGVSAATARLCTLMFALVAMGGLYVLMRRFGGALIAACSVLALLAMPSVVEWGRQAMLEMPTLAVLIWSLIAAHNYYQRPNWRRLTWWVFLCFSAVMFKQTAAFIFLPNAIILLVWTIRRHTPWPHLVAAGLASLITVGGYFVLISLREGSGPLVFEVIHKGKSLSEMLAAQSWLTYGRWLPNEASWLVIVLAVVGLIVTFRRVNLLTAMMVMWFVSFYIQVSLIQHKEPRYFYFGLLPIAVWAGAGVGSLIAGLKNPRVCTAAVGILTMITSFAAYYRPVPYRPDYGPLVWAYRDRLAGGVILFDGLRDSDFIFAVRQHLGPRKCVIVRASKILYACATLPEFRFSSYVESSEQVDAILKDFAFDGIFIERIPKMQLKEEQLLRASLKNSRDYALAASHTMRAGPGIEPTPITSVDIDVYLPKNSMERQVKNYKIPIPVDNRTVYVSLNELLADGR